MTKTKKPQQRSSKLFAYFSNSSLVKEVLLIILLLLSFSSTIYALVTNPPAFLVLSRMVGLKIVLVFVLIMLVSVPCSKKKKISK